MVVGSGTRGTLKEDVTPTQQQTKTEQKVDYPGAEGRANIIKPGHWSRRWNGSRPRRGNAGDTSTDTSAPSKTSWRRSSRTPKRPTRRVIMGLHKELTAAVAGGKLLQHGLGPEGPVGKWKSADTKTNSGRRNLSETGALVLPHGQELKSKSGSTGTARR